MMKRFLLIGTLCMALVPLWLGHAHAWPASSSGWYVTYNTIHVDSTWLGIGNAELNPTYIQVTIVPDNVVVYYSNHGGNIGGIGVPFKLNVDVTGVDALIPKSASKNGKFTSSVVFEDNVILNAIGQETLDANAPNPNWTAYAVDVTGMFIFIQAFENVSDICPNVSPNNTDLDRTNDTCLINYDASPWTIGTEEEVVHIQGYCTLKNFEYSCTEDVHWEWSKKDQVYP